MIKVSNRAKLMAGGAFVALASGGYGPRGAYAGSCTQAGGFGTPFVCSGAADPANDRNQALNNNGLNVTASTVNGFGISTTGEYPGNAINIFGNNGVEFIDNYASDITGANFGIVAIEGSSGTVNITSTGSISGLGGDGVLISSSASISSTVSLTLNDVYGASSGVYATAEGSAFISSTGDVTGASNYGVRVGGSTVGDVTVNVGNVSGGSIGIGAVKNGSGVLSITSTGTVTGTTKTGVSAGASANASVYVNVNDVTGGGDGVYANSSGGNVSVTVTGTATGQAGDGVDARSFSGTVTANVNNATGAQYGVNAFTANYGDVNVTSSGTISGGFAGVRARTANGEIRMSLNNVSGAEYGVDARAVTAPTSYSGEYNDRNINISTDGSVSASSGTAIVSRTFGNYQYITTNGDVDGATNGIRVTKDQYFYQPVAAVGPEVGQVNAPRRVQGGYAYIYTYGAVKGGAGAAIVVEQVDNAVPQVWMPEQPEQPETDGPTEMYVPAGNITQNYGRSLSAYITVNGAVSSDNGVAIEDRGARTSLYLNSGAEITGDVLLGNNGDSLFLNGVTLTEDAAIFAGKNEDEQNNVEQNNNLFFRGGANDSIIVTGDSTVVGSKLYDFNSLFVSGGYSRGPDDEPERGVLRFADVDTITLEAPNYGRRVMDIGPAQYIGRKRVLGPGAISAFGGEIAAGTDLTINAYNAVFIGNSYSYDFESSSTVLQSQGELSVNGTPGASRVEMNFSSDFEYNSVYGGGLYNAGLINMRNSGAGDQIIVNGGLLNTGDISIDISPQVGTDTITVRDDAYVSGNIDVNVIDANTLGRTEHVVISSTSGTITEGLPDLQTVMVNAPDLAENEEEMEDTEEPRVVTVSTDSVVADVDVRVEETEVIVGVAVNFVPVEPPVDPPVDPVDPPVDPVDPPVDPVDPPVVDPSLPGNGGLTPNSVAVGQNLNETINDPALAEIRAAAIAAGDIATLEQLYQRLGGSDFHAPVFLGAIGGMAFGQGLFSCAVGEGQFAAIDEGQCGWTRIGGSYTDRDGSRGNPGFDESDFNIAVGGQFELDENIRLGASLGYTAIDADGDLGLDFSGDRIAAGVSAKYVEGQFMAGVSLSGGMTFSDTERTVAGFGTAEADFDTFDFSVLARAAYLLDAGDGIYVKPQIEGGLTYIDRESFTETGAGAANLTVQSDSETFLSISPSIEVGGDFDLGDGMTARPYVRVGATFLSEDTVDTTARFAVSNSPNTFTTSVERDDLFANVAAGVTVFSESDVTVRAEYQGSFADDTMSHGGFLKLQFKF